jgi:hypothetical protein
VPEKKKSYRPPIAPDVKDTLDFFVARGIINYSSWDECYFYLAKNNDLIVLDFALDEWFKRKKDDTI